MICFFKKLDNHEYPGKGTEVSLKENSQKEITERSQYDLIDKRIIHKISFMGYSACVKEPQNRDGKLRFVTPTGFIKSDNTRYALSYSDLPVILEFTAAHKLVSYLQQISDMISEIIKALVSQW